MKNLSTILVVLLAGAALAASQAAAGEDLRSLRSRAEAGDAAAQYKLGISHFRGEGVPEDHAEAAGWIRRAAEQGLVEAQIDLGVMYHQGLGVAQNSEEASIWLCKAAEENKNVDAWKRLTRWGLACPE